MQEAESRKQTDEVMCDGCSLKSQSDETTPVCVYVRVGFSSPLVSLPASESCLVVCMLMLLIV